MDAAEEARNVELMTHLGRYFARCWISVQPHSISDLETAISRRLSTFESGVTVIMPASRVGELKAALADLPSGLDRSKLQLLVDPETSDLTDDVDSSLSSEAPLGVELDRLWYMSGCMHVDGWYEFNSRIAMVDAFWEEVWTGAGIEGDEKQKKRLRITAERVSLLGSVLRYGFEQEVGWVGRPSETPATTESIISRLKPRLTRASGIFKGDVF